MYQCTRSSLILGLTAIPVEVECFIGSGMPYFNIVGISSTSAAAARERIRSALKFCSLPLPPSRITVNIRSLRPDIHIQNSHYSALDLPIALAILACQKLIPPSSIANSVFLGELSLNGDLKPITGALSSARNDYQSSVQAFIVPKDNAAEAALSGQVNVYGFLSLMQVIAFLRNQLSFLPSSPAKPEIAAASCPFDTIHGQEAGKRALMIAAAGMHNLLLIGPPGCGKTLLARSLPALLPPLDYSQQLELTEIYSCANLLPNGCSILTERPFRSPHHSIPVTSLIGGGQHPYPGEITLSHHGILYLDELSEFSRNSLESLRQPLEDHHIILNRLRSTFRYPADFLLIASMNPCPCGHYPDQSLCHCPPSRIQQYFQKINSPLLDRIDLVLSLAPVTLSTSASVSALTFSKVKAMVQSAHQTQAKRYASSRYYNSRMTPQEIQTFCSLSPSLQTFLEKAYRHYHLSMRSLHKVLRVSRTLADLDQSDEIKQVHLAEALQYRPSSHTFLTTLT